MKKIIILFFCFLVCLSCSQAIKDLASEAKSVLAEVQNSGSSKSVGALNSEIKKLEKKLEEKEEELEEIEDDIADKEEDLEEVEEELAEIEERLEDTEELTPSQRQALEDRRDELIAEKTRLDRQISSLTTERNQAREALQTAETVRDTALTQRNTAQAERDTARAQILRLCRPEWTALQTHTEINMDYDEVPETDLYIKIVKNNNLATTQEKFLKYLNCHENPKSITLIRLKGTKFDPFNDLDTNNNDKAGLLSLFTSDIFTALGLSSAESDWNCPSGKYYCETTQGFLNGRTEPLKIYVMDRF